MDLMHSEKVRIGEVWLSSTLGHVTFQHFLEFP